MSLFEFFHEKKVELQSEERVFPLFKTVHSITEVLQEISGDVIIIMKHIDAVTARWIIDYRGGKCDIFTTEPKTLEEFDNVSKIREKYSVYTDKPIDINYIHYNNTLVIVPDSFSDSLAPNIVTIESMSRKDIEMYISIDIGEVVVIPQQTAIQSANAETAEVEDNEEKKEPDELRLLREEITKRMNDAYSIVRVEMKNASIERKTISLTEFYKKNGIAQGRLRGTWEVFDKEKISEIIDTGIAQRALDEVKKKYTVVVESAYRLIKKSDIEAFKKEIKQIEDDYSLYLRGKKTGENDKIGNIKISVAFSPQDAIDKTIEELREYLYGIVVLYSGKGRLNTDVFQSVDRFANKAKWEISESMGDIASKSVFSAFAEEQLKDVNYVEKLCQCLYENTDYFGKDIYDLLCRYLTELGRWNNCKCFL